MSTHDDITPVALHLLFRRLLDDHQRMNSHHAHLCPLCKDTEHALDLLAEQLPDAESCSGCCAPAGEPHADTCPGKDGNCPGCAVAPGQAHLPYCPEARAGSLFRPAGAPAHRGAVIDMMTRTGFRCGTCCAKADEPHADTCQEKDGERVACARPGQDPKSIPLGISHYQLADGTVGGSYPSPAASHAAGANSSTK